LTAVIDNNNGHIGGNASINMNVSGNANVTNDAQINILGSGGASAAAINFPGGTYNVGGMFRSTISDNGTLTFNNTSVQADVFKAGVFGPNGTLNVNGGNLSANTEFKLYAPGSNGSITFGASVTLSSTNAPVIIAANTVTILDNVTVFIMDNAGIGPAQVFANVRNYFGSGGNNTTSGRFTGAGATSQPLDPHPPFDGPIFGAETAGTSVATTTPGHATIERTRVSKHRAERGDLKASAIRAAAPTLNISNTTQLLSLLDDATPAAGGKISVPAAKRTGGSKHSGRIDSGNRLKPDRVAADIRQIRERQAFNAITRQ